MYMVAFAGCASVGLPIIGRAADVVEVLPLQELYGKSDSGD